MIKRIVIKKGTLILFLSVFCLFLYALKEYAFADDASPYFYNTRYNRFIAYAINSGRIRMPFVLNQPFTCAELMSAFYGTTGDSKALFFGKTGNVLIKDLTAYDSPDSGNTHRGYWHLRIGGGYRSGRERDESINQFHGFAEGTYASPHFILANKTITDQAYRDDPDFYGDTGEWIWGRSEAAYALMKWGGVSLFAGRLSRNFGLLNEPSLILSSNPYSYDHFGFQYESRRFRFSFYISRLNDISGFDSQAEDTSEDEVRAKRYFAIQRGEFALRYNLHIGLSQVAVYGGPDRDFEAVYLNPLNLFYVCQRNHGSQMSGLWAIDVFWKPFQNLTLYNQFLIDDFIINNEPGRDDRARHPDRIGLLSKCIITDAVVPGTQVSLVYHRISNWTYMSYRTWENYVFHGKSMGFPDNSVEGVTGEVAWFGAFPFTVVASAGYNRHGDQDINAVFGDTKDPFPMGIDERNTFAALSVRYMPCNRIHANADMRYDAYDNDRHRKGVDKRYFSFRVSVQAELYWGFRW